MIYVGSTLLNLRSVAMPYYSFFLTLLNCCFQDNLSSIIKQKECYTPRTSYNYIIECNNTF